MISRSTRFLADKYKLDMSSAANLNHVNKAIARGVEVGVFDQPKGAGGKVKIVKKVRIPAQSLLCMTLTRYIIHLPIDRCQQGEQGERSPCRCLCHQEGSRYRSQEGDCCPCC